jgi:Rod binding domain-containing protein
MSDVLNSLDPMAAAGLHARRSPADMENRQLKEAAQQFEGMLIGIMLKEAMRENLSEKAGDSAAGFDQFRDFCLEQVSTSMAETSTLGIADQIYEQLSQSGARR